MRVLIDILHPAHVHFYRNFHQEMEARGHELHITARAKDRSLDLLDQYHLPYDHISDQKSGGTGLVLEMTQRTGRLMKVMKEFRPDVMTGIMGPSIAVAGKLKRVPAVVFYDTEFAKQTNWFVYPLAYSVCTPDCYQGNVRGTHVTYVGYHELAYLHPNRFQPDPSRLAAFGIAPSEPYSLVRFVSWQAVHDKRETGLSGTQKRDLVAMLSEHGRVLISSEGALPTDLAQYEVKGPVQDIHHLLAHAQMIVGESATMSSEAAVLGVPAVMIATSGRGYTDDEEKRYGLVRHFTEDQYDAAVATIEKLFADSPREFGQRARQQLLADKIDVTQWMVDYFESNFGSGEAPLMCGIAGTFGFGDDALIRAMTDTLIYRGPDGDGFYVRDGVCLGNRRLAILDPASGAQPMTNEDGDVIVVFNGLIYNYPDLREHLLRHGHTLHTNCDTEILAHLYEDEGIGFAAKLNGIFAFALFDRRRRKLFVVRDPVGVKPVVYTVQGRQVAFASEAKAVLASGIIGAELDEASLHLSMNVRYVPGTRTLFRGIQRLAPGHVLEITDDAAPREYPYTSIDWTPDDTRTRSEWMEGIRTHLAESVKRQLLSDVPLGVSLSGGIDSSSVVAMVRRAHSGPIKTFSLGFNEPWDELDDARFVAETYETDHHELVLTEPVLPYLAEAIRHTEEPKVNSLQLYLLHRYIGEHVTVVLSGLGGDELFAGYDIYGYLQRTERMRSGAVGAGVRALGPALDWTARRVASLGRPQLDLATRKIEWLASSGDPARHYLLLRNAWDFNQQMLHRVYTPEFADRVRTSTRDEFDRYFDGNAPIEADVLRAEFSTKMECDFLHNEDTMSMAHSVESRVPLLDLEMVRFAARIPDHIRFGSGMKGLLKDSMRGVLPDRVLDKKKWGFTFDPVEQYQKDLGPMARELLTPDRLRASGIFNPKFVQAVLDTKPHQRLRWHYFMLWQMIGFELWHDTFIGSPAPTTAPRPWVRSATGEGR